jgi:hypothetical protein
MVLDGTRFGADPVNSTFRDPGEYFERPGKIDLIDQRKDQYADIGFFPRSAVNGASVPTANSEPEGAPATDASAPFANSRRSNFSDSLLTGIFVISFSISG